MASGIPRLVTGSGQHGGMTAIWAFLAAGLGASVPALAVTAWWWRKGRMTAPAGARPPGADTVEDALGRVEDQLRRMEAERQHLAGGVREQLRLLQSGQELLRGETVKLSRALRDPFTRGRWGEVQLRRVVEMAGMLAQCDFVEQPRLQHEDGPLRPDMVIQLPGGRSLVVDAKVPLKGWLEALEAPEGARRAHLIDHARQLRAHVTTLAAREYWAALPCSPEMVVAFLPADALLSAALEADPDILDYAVGQRVMLATPVTLIAMLRAVSFGWQQEALVEDARAVGLLGRELHRRLGTFAEHLDGIGRALERAVTNYNDAVGSLESRVMVSARRLADYAGGNGPVDGPAPVNSLPRSSRTVPQEAETG
jgi:DNA recombination protein RmuC